MTKGKNTYTFAAEVVPYPGMGGWHFAYLDKATAEKVKKSQEGKPRVGWGSIRVEAHIGNTTWNSSIFPDKKSGTYLLPLKAAVRKKEGLAAHDKTSVTIQLAG